MKVYGTGGEIKETELPVGSCTILHKVVAGRNAFYYCIETVCSLDDGILLDFYGAAAAAVSAGIGQVFAAVVAQLKCGAVPEKKQKKISSTIGVRDYTFISLGKSLMDRGY